MDQLSHIDEYQIPQLVSEVEDISLSWKNKEMKGMQDRNHSLKDRY